MQNLSLPIRQPTTPGILPSRTTGEEPRLKWQDPAILAVTDFTQECPVTVDKDRPIDDALNDMVRLGVRALVVIDDRGVAGLVTSYDIQGERPMQFLHASSYSRHGDVRVGHIMTPWERLTAIDWSDLRVACIGQLTEVFEHTQATHLVVLESLLDAAPSIMRGLISRTRVVRQLGLGIGRSERPSSWRQQGGMAGSDWDRKAAPGRFTDAERQFQGTDGTPGGQR